MFLLTHHHATSANQGIARRMKSVGLILPKEHVWGRILQAAQVAGLDVADSTASVEYKRQLKSMLAKMSKGITITKVVFPVNPCELECFAESYGDEDQPVRLDEDSVIQQDVSLRGSKREVKQRKLSGPMNPKALPMVEFQQDAQPAMQNMMMMLMQQMNQMMWHSGSNPDARGSGVGLGNFRPAAAPKVKMLMPDPATHASSAHAAAPAAAPLQAIEDKQPGPQSSTKKNGHEGEMSPNKAMLEVNQPEAAVLLETTPKIPGPMKRPAGKAVPTPKPKAQGAKGKGGSKPSGKGKSKAVKPVKQHQIIKCKGGWSMEIRVRESGQKDKHFRSPSGKMFRIQAEAVAAGFPGR